jgi:protocatechuate 3,4-dioxygenase, alpha subunit
MTQSLDYLRETVSQTAGPYVHIGLAPGAAGFKTFETELGQCIATDGVPGTRITIQGMVLDGTGSPVRDVLLEVWQADANGIYPHPEDPRAADCAPGFRGWGRVITDFDTGLWTFDTIMPGSVAGRAGNPQAPHISIWLVARGINVGLNTRMYFPLDSAAQAIDPVLTSIEHPGRRQTLIATQIGPDSYRFDIRLQGDNETVFIDV